MAHRRGKGPASVRDEVTAELSSLLTILLVEFSVGRRAGPGGWARTAEVRELDAVYEFAGVDLGLQVLHRLAHRFGQLALDGVQLLPVGLCGGPVFPFDVGLHRLDEGRGIDGRRG